MVSWIPLVLSLVSSAVSAKSSHDAQSNARKSQERYDKGAKGALNRWDEILSAGFPKVRGKLAERRGVINQGFSNAQRETEIIGQGATRRTLEREGSTLGDIQGGLNRRGVLDTSIFDQARRSVRDDTERSLLDIDERLAQIRSSIEVNRTNALDNAVAGEADFEYRAVQDRADVERSRASYYGNRQVAPAQGLDLSGLTSVIPYLSGGSGGGGGGSSGGGRTYNRGLQI